MTRTLDPRLRSCSSPRCCLRLKWRRKSLRRCCDPRSPTRRASLTTAWSAHCSLRTSHWQMIMCMTVRCLRYVRLFVKCKSRIQYNNLLYMCKCMYTVLRFLQFFIISCFDVISNIYFIFMLIV